MAVMLPLSSTLEFSLAAELGIALLLGLGFGFCLERAGFGSARKLTAVFYLYDMAVVKVMFSAIVTTLAGLFLLSAVGWMDLSELYIEPTNWVAAVIGGAVFGAGFVIGGYCPGTSIAALATGRQDAMVFALGMLAGVIGYAEGASGLEAWVRSFELGEMTLPSLTGIGMGWWVIVFVAFLAFAAWGMGRLEQRFAHWKPQA
jgi:hypothetical protein